MRYELREAVTAEQVAAATRIHDKRMPAWAASDCALDLLREALPGFEEPRALIKAAAIDRLYYSRHPRLVEAVRQIAEVMASPPMDPISIVEAFAPVPGDAGTACYWSFSSKFAHFFVDPGAFPIYDGWAIKSVRHHFGRLSWREGTPYRVFTNYVFALRELSSVSCSIRELDRYLWLCGMLRGWQSNRDVEISREVRGLFENSSAEVQRELKLLLGR